MTEQLTPSDPVRIGGHRLLARLGAGGMGVVYLGRTDAGELAAVKVIRPEYAAEPDFRARFRREVAAARRVRSPWAVPVTGAGPDAEAPWLATEFVPGPALAEAVAVCGPLPERGTRILGKTLARALAAVHAAGLVHRDVKPGNVLLAVDGPRLIDFGIARAPGATALTESDVVIGTPGYLAPEQAGTGAGEAGPAADVFALGCVLAFASSGRRPFGTGHPAAVVFRTVHEPPDLSGVPEGTLRGWVERCLRKPPAERPPAEELAAGLAAAADVPGFAAADERGSAAAADSAWLPPAVLRIVAERSARALDIPAPPPRRRRHRVRPARRHHPARRLRAPAHPAPVPGRRVRGRGVRGGRAVRVRAQPRWHVGRGLHARAHPRAARRPQRPRQGHRPRPRARRAAGRRPAQRPRRRRLPPRAGRRRRRRQR